MMSLSVRARESIKTGLAMATAYGLSMRMDFGEPLWAGFAVAMVSLDTAGQSLNKAALRIFGTGVAFVASLTFAALFPQQRWAMLLVLTPYIGFCTYMIAGKRRQYFWFVTAFVCLTIMLHGGADSASMFRYAVARVEETALGILVYSAICIFLWPRSGRDALHRASRDLFDTQRHLYRAYRGLLRREGRVEDSRQLRLQELQLLTQLGQALDAAETDTYEVWELRHAWRRFLQQTSVLAEALGRWRTSLPEVGPLDLDRILPGLEAALAELEARLDRIAGMLGRDETASAPVGIDLGVPEHERRALSHFQRAEVELLTTQLRNIDETSRTLFECVREIRGSGPITTRPLRGAARLPSLVFDPDRFESAVTTIAAMWVSFGVWVWLDPPGGGMFWYMATLWTMVSILARRPPHLLLPAFVLGLAVGGLAYMGVMPHLSGYGELALMLFAVTAVSYYLLTPALGSLFMAIFMIAVDIGNPQTYSFSSFANGSAAAILLTLGLASAVWYFPRSPRPEKLFLRLLARFFRHSEILMSKLAPEAQRRMGLIDRWRSAWYRDDLLELPVKLVALAEKLDYRLLPGTGPEQVRALVLNLTSITHRIKELLDARRHVEADPRLEEVVAELREWRLLAQRQFRLWSEDPSAALHPDADMSERLHARLARIEADLEAARARAGDAGLSVNYEACYRYLGGFRGLSEDTIGYAGVAETVSFHVWREPRF